MSPEDKERVSLQIAATEARTEAHMAEIRGALAVIDQRLADRDHAYDARFAAIDARFATIEQAIRDLVQAMARLRATVIVTAITAALTTIFGVAAFNATLLSGMVTSFDSGRDIGGTHAELQRQIADINATLKRLEARQTAESPPTAPPPAGRR